MKTFAQFIQLDEFALPTPPKKLDWHKALGLPKQKGKSKPKKKAAKKLKIKAPFEPPKIPSLVSIAKKAVKDKLFPKPVKPKTKKAV